MSPPAAQSIGNPSEPVPVARDTAIERIVAMIDDDVPSMNESSFFHTDFPDKGSPCPLAEAWRKSGLFAEHMTTIESLVKKSEPGLYSAPLYEAGTIESPSESQVRTA